MYMLYICLLAPLIQNGFSLIGEEIDLNSLSNYDSVDDLNEASEIWNTENDDGDTIIVDSISKQLLENICENSNTRVYIAEEDIIIDCKTFDKGDKPIENVHSVVKRSVDEQEEELEGSGNGVGEQNVNDVTTEETNVDNQEETTEADGNEDTEAPDEETKFAAEETEIAAKEEQVETTQKATTEIAEEVEDNVETTTKIIEATENLEEDQNNDETNTEIIPEEPTESTEKITETIPEATTEKSDEVADNVISKEENEAKETESETIRESDKTEQRNKTGKSLIDLSLTSHSNVSDDSVKTDGSTENTKKAGSKDTTILVGLFVAVVVVGAAAFAYNFIKKRKQRAADLETVERSPIKRSLQNLTKIENGEHEKKPLIGDNKEVEMVEMKKESTALKENGESAPSEVTVKI